MEFGTHYIYIGTYGTQEAILLIQNLGLDLQDWLNFFEYVDLGDEKAPKTDKKNSKLYTVQCTYTKWHINTVPA